MELVVAIVSGILSGGTFSFLQFLISRKDTKLKNEFDALREEIKENRATDARIRILAFSDEIRRGVRHSEESFNQINVDIDTYKRYCKDHPEYENNRAVMAIANIERVYGDCLEQNDFLE